MISFQGIRNTETEKNHSVIGEVKTYQMDPAELERIYGSEKGKKTNTYKMNGQILSNKGGVREMFNLALVRGEVEAGLTKEDIEKKYPSVRKQSISRLHTIALKHIARDQALKHIARDQENHIADVGKKVQEVKVEKVEKVECNVEKEINSDVPSVSVEQRKEETAPSIHVERIETKIGRIIMPCDLMGLEGVRWR